MKLDKTITDLKSNIFLLPLFFIFCIDGWADTGIQKESREPPAKGAIESSIRKGIDFLVSDQNKNGSWGSARNTKGLNIYAPVPGAHDAFRAAITAMCVTALIETDAAKSDISAKESLAKGEKWLLENLGSIRRANHDAVSYTHLTLPTIA